MTALRARGIKRNKDVPMYNGNREAAEQWFGSPFVEYRIVYIRSHDTRKESVMHPSRFRPDARHIVGAWCTAVAPCMPWCQ